MKEVYEQVMELMARYELRRSLLYEEIARLTAPIRHAKVRKAGIHNTSQMEVRLKKAKVKKS